MILILIAAIVFIIAIFHFYWAFGGKTGLSVALPQLSSSQDRVFTPSPLMTAGVAAIFLLISGLFFMFGIGNIYPEIFHKQILSFLAIVFFIRSIGDFKYVGFFKNVSGTDFAKYDNKYFSPLCLVMGILILITIYL